MTKRTLTMNHILVESISFFYLPVNDDIEICTHVPRDNRHAENQAAVRRIKCSLKTQ